MRLTDILLFHSSDTPSQNIKTRVHGLPVTIEHPKGSLRTLHDDSGKVVYSRHMYNHYGFFNKTKGRDGDEVDCIIGPMKNASEVYIVHMLDRGPVESEREDEDKVMVGFPSADSAKKAFVTQYPPSFYGGMTALPVAEFCKRLKTASLPYRRKKITAVGRKRCPHCGSRKYGLMPTDFETAKCENCGKNFQVGVEK